MEGDILAVVKFVQLIAHVLEQQAILLRIAFQATFQKTQNELHPTNWYDSPLMYINNVPSVLEVAYVCVRQQGILLVRIK